MANRSSEHRVECYLCHKAEEDDPEVEIRYYGPKGAPICFDCMIASPEREKEAQRQFSAQLDACGPVAVCDGSSTGPRPMEKSRG
jgi:hypothetical protein